MRGDASPREQMDSLRGVMHHLTDAWSRRSRENLLLVHYDDLQADLTGEMRRVADRLGIVVPDETWPTLVEAAGFASMRDRAEQLTPNSMGILKDPHAFFRRGGSGAGREALTVAELDEYVDRVAAMAPADMLAWLHRG
jgi:hypothetical protein